MGFDYLARVRVGVILLVLFALYSNLQLLTESLKSGLAIGGNDEVSRYERRFDSVRRMLPSYGVIGYVGDARYNADGSLNGWAMRNWYLAQYTLAPVVLSQTSGHRIYLFNQSPDVSDPQNLKEGDFLVQELAVGGKILNFGDGVKLLLNESQ